MEPGSDAQPEEGLEPGLKDLFSPQENVSNSKAKVTKIQSWEKDLTVAPRCNNTGPQVCFTLSRA